MGFKRPRVRTSPLRPKRKCLKNGTFSLFYGGFRTLLIKLFQMNFAKIRDSFAYFVRFSAHLCTPKTEHFYIIRALSKMLRECSFLFIFLPYLLITKCSQYEIIFCFLTISKMSVYIHCCRYLCMP